MEVSIVESKIGNNNFSTSRNFRVQHSKKALIILIIILYSVSREIYAICEWILHLFKDFFPKKDYKWNRENSQVSEY